MGSVVLGGCGVTVGTPGGSTMTVIVDALPRRSPGTAPGLFLLVEVGRNPEVLNRDRMRFSRDMWTLVRLRTGLLRMDGVADG